MSQVLLCRILHEQGDATLYITVIEQWMQHVRKVIYESVTQFFQLYTYKSVASDTSVDLPYSLDFSAGNLKAG